MRPRLAIAITPAKTAHGVLGKHGIKVGNLDANKSATPNPIVIATPKWGWERVHVAFPDWGEHCHSSDIADDRGHHV